MGWQDPSADLENVNAAYRMERENNERLEMEVERLRNIIGRLYVGRGGDRHTLYSAIRRAFGESQPEVAEKHWQHPREGENA